MNNYPEKSGREDEIGADAGDENTTNKSTRNGIKSGEWRQKMVHDLPQDEQMNDEFGKGGEPIPPGEAESDKKN